MTTLSLSKITRISPLNPNQDMVSDVSSLAATIRAIGMQYPLTVRERPDAAGEYEVLDGGRRWRALRLLCEGLSGHADEKYPAVEIFDGSEADALQLALTLSVTPHTKHPVDEFERFSQLVEQHGKTVADIARDFGETERHVRQRLALGALSPRVRELWRKGEITRDSAEAYTIAPLAAQEALLDDWAKRGSGSLNHPTTIRAALRGDTMVASDPVAKFLCADPGRLEVYRGAGGRLMEDLFSEQPGLQDPSIARRIAMDFLRAEALRFAEAEGWGHAFAGEDEGGFDQFFLSDEEKGRLDEIARELAGECTKAKRKKLTAEREAILSTVDDRADYGVRADLDCGGEIYLTRGVALPDEAAQSASGRASPERADNQPAAAAPDAAAGESGEKLSPGAEKTPLGEPGKQLRAVIDAGATHALRDAVRARPDIAMMLAVAALGCQYGVVGLGLRPVQSRDPEDNDLLKRIRPLAFQDALAGCAEASTCDLTVAFARIMAAAIETGGLGFDEIGVLFRAVAARGGDVAGALERNIDRRGYFEAAEKERTARIVGALIGPAEAARVKGWKKDKLAQHAATLSKEQGHLPPPFSAWSDFPARPGALDDAIYSERQEPLAEAMRDAIEKDEASSGCAGAERDANKSSGQGGKSKGKKRGPRKTPIERAIENTEGAPA
jgi:ParB family chromosome partitioning protein